MLIGIDLDNTIIQYDTLFHTLAFEEGLIGPDHPAQKEAIRDSIRLLPGGNARWTRLQALAYGPRLSGAFLFPGVTDFFQECRTAGLSWRIVSHKTQTALLDGTDVQLRQAAMEYLDGKGFFSTLGLSREEVFFEATRPLKVARIHALGCTHFIDDLPEVFAEPGFPEGTQQILFRPHPLTSPIEGACTFQSWEEVRRLFFGHGR
jgi:hypothetical protein